ncbi:uncharacterized protein LOC122266228 [Penaeus japonicus]|uniref:uncharacterized protein LOC122266228 n=1 Tax=Penaeus japonicus TaxID=27405 RepID=UPI001C717A7E|nr:uncharacterized protein LOC122266228 [Penaeus japonicus]
MMQIKQLYRPTFKKKTFKISNKKRTFSTPTGSQDKHMKTWLNLVELQQEGGEGWMEDSDTDVWNGLLAPTFRSDWDLCALVGCTGSSLQLCGNSGCHKSDIGSDPF